MERSPLDRSISFGFTAIIMIFFGGFLACAAAFPASLTHGVFGIIPLSMVLAASLILGAVALTALYVIIANGRDR
jgi:uncharacterized membrane protein (DUF485 family)